METLGKVLVGTAIALVLVGGALLFTSRLGLDRLPGDLVFRAGT